jgi:hypothetical protein
MRYEKYIDCEFSYFDKYGKCILLVLTGIIKRDKQNYFDVCEHCGKPLKSTIYTFTRTDSGQNEEYIFGSECVKHVFGAGLGENKEV